MKLLESSNLHAIMSYSLNFSLIFSKAISLNLNKMFSSACLVFILKFLLWA